MDNTKNVNVDKRVRRLDLCFIVSVCIKYVKYKYVHIRIKFYFLLLS